MFIDDDGPNINMIDNDTQFSENKNSTKLNEQKENFSDTSKQRRQIDQIPQRTTENQQQLSKTSQSYSDITSDIHISSNDHEIMLTTASSINKSNEQDKKISNSLLPSLTVHDDQQKITHEQKVNFSYCSITLKHTFVII